MPKAEVKRTPIEVSDETELLIGGLGELLNNFDIEYKKGDDTKFTDAIEYIRSKKNGQRSISILKTAYRSPIEGKLNQIGEDILKTDGSVESVAEVVYNYTKGFHEEQDLTVTTLANKVRKAKISTKNTLNAFGLPIGVWNTAIETAALAIEAGGKTAEVISKMLSELKSKYSGFNIEEDKNHLIKSGVKFDADVVSEPTKPKGEMRKSGFQERSIERGENERVKEIARNNEVYYESVNQKEEYERSKP